MSLFDFFFPEQAQATHLRSLAKGQRYKNRRAARRTGALNDRLESLENDVGYLALVLGALLQQVDEKGVLSRDDVRATVAELDEIDGVKDGKLDVDILRGMGR
jgi:hypothetical protein